MFHNTQNIELINEFQKKYFDIQQGLIFILHMIFVFC